MATYAYAGNNPVRWSDSTGLDIEGDKATCSSTTLKLIEKLRTKLRNGTIKSQRCKKLFDDVGLTDLAKSDTMHTIFCWKKADPQECPGASSSDGLCGAADPESCCVRVKEKAKGCDVAGTIGHELAHNTGAWPEGTRHGEIDFDAVEKCAIEVVNEK